ncbi:hypothetical protein RDI58_008344 [Solanum bulbocastanum]|uniref:Uncharacterized protein n=1 Tax=Solanum bulbocastanum TaxID=147425 RepID=A0AAN8YK25_SOLBU
MISSSHPVISAFHDYVKDRGVPSSSTPGSTFTWTRNVFAHLTLAILEDTSSSWNNLFLFIPFFIQSQNHSAFSDT